MASNPAASPRRLLVTGHSGFVARAVRQYVNAADDGADRWTMIEWPEALDLRDRTGVRDFVVDAGADFVLHLAAQSSVAESFRDPAATLDVNVSGTLFLLEALCAARFRGRMLYVGSGDVYGLVPEGELPISETRVCRPRSPYGVSKAAAEMLCWQWHVSAGVDVVLARPFNHIGAGQSAHFAISDFARQIAAITLGLQEPTVRVGDLQITRDFTNVNDVVEAYFALLDAGASGEIYNVCSGTERSIASMLEELISLAGVDVRIAREETRIRQSEQRRMCGDAGKLMRATGWRPRVPIRTSLQQALHHWQGTLQNA